ncbi:MAG: DUF4286 family protein [Saprospiraceae bacterium]|nr:DUF4286 family protein [Bacteroidia bacterium]NNF20588.1 DUF4286 family protein [Saprospiraceae bacterium]
MNPFLYNITFKLSGHLSASWLSNMQEKYLPACIIENIPLSAQINRIMLDDLDGDHTYAVQFTFSSQGVFENEGKEILKKLVILIDEDFKNQYVYFGTLMEVVHSVYKENSI